MKAYDTVTEAITDLKKRGYTTELILATDCLICSNTHDRLSPAEFDIDELYRFEGNTDPDDEAILYAISSVDGSIKGTLVNAYGVYSDPASGELVSKLHLKHT